MISLIFQKYYQTVSNTENPTEGGWHCFLPELDVPLQLHICGFYCCSCWSAFKQ